MSSPTPTTGSASSPGRAQTGYVTVEANYIHTLTHWSVDPAHVDGTHNDCIQIQGGANILIGGNTIVADSTEGPGSVLSVRGNHAAQGILVQSNTSLLSNVVIDKNWHDNGSASLYLHPGSFSDLSPTTVTNNRLGRNQYDCGNGSKYAVRVYSKAVDVAPGLDQPGNTTNRWEDTGELLVEGRNLGIRYDVP